MRKSIRGLLFFVFAAATGKYKGFGSVATPPDSPVREAIPTARSLTCTLTAEYKETNEDYAASCEDLPAVTLTVDWYSMEGSMGA